MDQRNIRSEVVAPPQSWSASFAFQAGDEGVNRLGVTVLAGYIQLDRKRPETAAETPPSVAKNNLFTEKGIWLRDKQFRNGIHLCASDTSS